MSIDDKQFDCYIAGPWFSSAQRRILEEVIGIVKNNTSNFFSPKDANLYVEGVTTPEEVLHGNIAAINNSKCIIVITDGKDVGTIWEAGYAYAKEIPILYVWLTRLPGQKFNLMLGASGEIVHNMDDLDFQLYHFRENLSFDKTLNKDYDYE